MGIQQKKERLMQRRYVTPFTSEAIDSIPITEKIDNSLLIKDLLSQSQQQKHQNK